MFLRVQPIWYETMKTIYMEEALIRLAQLPQLASLNDGEATVIKSGDRIYADVVLKGSLKYFRVAIRDGKQERVFGSVVTASMALSKAGFGHIKIKYVDGPNKPEWIHAKHDEVYVWEQTYHALKRKGSIAELRDHLAVAPEVSPLREMLQAFIDGYDYHQKAI